MRTLCVALLMLSALCGVVYAQAAATDPVNGAKIEDIRPTVYMSVERKNNEKVWLRISNNTKWAIAVRTVSFYFNRTRKIDLASGKSVFALPSDEEIDSLHYYVEKEPMTRSHRKVPELRYPDSSSISWIPAKGSILFCTSIKQLAADLMVYVRFNYEWELNGQLIFNNEPEHRVYFRGSDLPALP